MKPELARSFSVGAATLRFAIPRAAAEWGSEAGRRGSRESLAVLKVDAGSGLRDGQLKDHRSFSQETELGDNSKMLGICKAHGRGIGMT